MRALGQMGKSSICSLSMDRWLALSAAMITMACGGLTYTYAVYSEHLKDILHYSQEQIDDVGVAKDFGAVIALFSGFLYNMYPPWVTMIIGALLHLLGYGLVWTTTVGKILPKFWLLCLSFAVGNGGDGWIDTACIMTSLQNFSEHRGTAMGLLKAQVGLSGALFIMVYEAFLEPNVDEYLLMMAIVPTIFFIVLAVFIQPFFVPTDRVDRTDVQQRFQMVHCIMIFMGLFLMATITFEAQEHLGKRFQFFITTAMLLIATLLFIIPVIPSPLDILKGCFKNLFPVKLEFHTQTSRKFFEDRPLGGVIANVHEDELVNLQEQLHSDGEDNFQGRSLSLEHHFTENCANMTLRASLLGLDFCCSQYSVLVPLIYGIWLSVDKYLGKKTDLRLVTFVVMSGGGCGLAIINNFGQIGRALGSSEVALYVGLISIWSCFGRLIAGYGSDFLMKHGYPRTVCLLVAQTTMVLCCLLLSTGFQSTLYIGSILVGLSYGSYWTLAPAILSEVFGLTAFASLYKIISLSAPLASYLLSAKVVGFFYDEQTLLYEKQHASELSSSLGGSHCIGRSCFGYALLVLASVGSIGALFCMWFMMRTRSAYLKVNYRCLSGQPRR